MSQKAAIMLKSSHSFLQPSPRTTHSLFISNSRVENWRSNHKALSPVPPRQTGQTVFPYTAFQSSSSRGFRFTWPSGIVPSEVPEIIWSL